MPCRFSASFERETIVRLPTWIPANQGPSKKGATLKGKNLLPLGANSKRKEFAPTGSKFFPFQVKPFSERRQNIWQSVKMYPIPITYHLNLLMTDSICHSSLPATVLEKVTDYYSISYLSAHKRRPNVSVCVCISTPLKRCPYKSSATCAWSMARVAEKTRLNIYVNNKGADQPARPCRLISAFVVRYSSFFSTKKCITNLNGEQNDTGNLLVFHRICHFRAIQPFDFVPVTV